jgi:predicted transcriptional regulator of viral defense system
MLQPAGISGKGRAELARVFGTGPRFIETADVATALDVDAATAAQKLARWAADGWVRRVRRGLYIGVPVDATDPSAWAEDALLVASAVWSPCYFTGWTAANHWSLTEQVFRTTVLKTTQRVRRSTARLLDRDYLLTHVTEVALTWGLKSEWHDETKLLFADPARMTIDVLDAPRLGGGIRHVADIVAAYLEDHDPDTLIDYGDRLGNRAVFKRLGYVLEALGIDAPDLVAASRRRISAGISALDPDGPSGGRRIMRWGLRVNVRVTDEGPS